MKTIDNKFTGSIPDIYDEFLVPLIFESYADDLANRTKSLAPKHLLETAAGSGVVTRAVAKLLPIDTEFTVTDLNAPMLERAKRRQSDDKRINWQNADALTLPFNDQSFDIVLCQFGVMFFPDRIRAFRETLRVLKPHGHFIFNVWDKIEENEFTDCVTRAAGEVFPNDPPMFLARTPHGHSDMSAIEQELREACFDTIEVEPIDMTCRAPTPRHPAIAYVQGTPLRNEIEARDANKLDDVTRKAESQIRARWGKGEVQSKIRAFVVTTFLSS